MSNEPADASATPEENPACPSCGAPIPADAPSKICPSCLAARVMMTGQDTLVGNNGFTPPTVEEMQRMIPQIEILEQLGAGGMGAVYKGLQKTLKRYVAIKLLPLELTEGDPSFTERFHREAQTMARLSHPNIVTIYDFGETTEGHCYIVMEFIEGSDLHQMIHGGGLTPAEALALVPQVCEGLQYAHDEGIVHRDIKPANILVDTKGRVKLTDFGLAKLFGNDTTNYGLTMTGTAMGTPDYAAPEQIKPDGALDHRVDIYSLGVVLYELLTGQVPRGVFEPPSKKKIEIDVRLDEVVIRAMQAEREQRYQQVSEIKTKVDEIREDESASDKKTASKKSNKGSKASRLPLWLGSAAAVLLLGFAIWKWMDQQPEEPAPLVDQPEPEILPTDPVKPDPAQAAKLIVEAKVLTEAGKSDRAAKKLQLAYRYSGNENPDIKADLAIAFHEAQRYIDARTVADEYSKLAAADHSRFQEVAKLRFQLDERFEKVDALLATARKKLKARDDQGELDACQEILKLVPDHPEATKAIAANPVDIKRRMDAAVELLRKKWANDPNWIEPRVIASRKDVSLVLSGVHNIEPLRGLPINYLWLCGTCTNISDISPLEGMPLVSLDLTHTRVKDLTPLKGMKLRLLKLISCPVTDLSPLSDVEVTNYLDLSRTPAVGYQVLEGRQIKKTQLIAREPLADVASAFIEKRNDVKSLADEVMKKYGGLNSSLINGHVHLLKELTTWRKSGTQTPPESAILVDGRYFAFIPLYLTPKEAQSFAEEHGASLAVLDTDEKKNAIKERITAQGFGNDSLWKVGNCTDERGNLGTKGACIVSVDSDSAERLDVDYYDAKSKHPFIIEWHKPMPGYEHKNSLGMHFLPVKAEGMERTLVSVYETRVSEYEQFIKETGYKPQADWRNPGYPQTGDHPARISWWDAREFCHWLTKKERKLGRLRAGECYRMPTQAEWLATAKAAYGQWPPKKIDRSKVNLVGDEDGHLHAAPVGSFPAVGSGIYDVIGNAMEWHESKTEMVDNTRYSRKLYGGSHEIKDIGARTYDGGSGQTGGRAGFRPVIALKTNHDVELATEVEKCLARLADQNMIENLEARYWVRDGKVMLDLSKDLVGAYTIKNIGVLKGLPIIDLNLYSSNVKDISALTGMPIRHLNLSYMPLTEISPLRGMPLKSLSLYNSIGIKDLSPLSNIKLEQLDIGRLQGDIDLNPLVGQPLKNLNLSASRIHDLSPLKKFPGLQFDGLTYHTAMSPGIVSFESGDFPAAAKHFQKFEKDFADFKPFAEYVEMAKPLRKLSQWAADGKKGIPLGAKTYQGSHYLRIKGYGVNAWSQLPIFKHLGGHRPVLSTREELDWFADNLGAWIWLGLEQDDKGAWKWTTGEPMTYKAEWSEKQHKTGKNVVLTGEKMWSRYERGHSFDFAIEWSNPMPGCEHKNSLGMYFRPVKAEGMERTLVSVYETRVKEFEQFIKETGYDAKEMWKTPGFKQTGDHPVVGVSWFAAKEFCHWLTQKERKLGRLRPGECYRLPTEAEWLAAAKASYGGKWPAENIDLTKTNLNGKDGFARTAPVGRFPATTTGFHDLVGNVSEWIDNIVPFTYALADFMGASWKNTKLGEVSSDSWRVNADNMGFRVVLSLKSEEDIKLATEVEERLVRFAQDNPVPADSPYKGKTVVRYWVSAGKVTLDFSGEHEGTTNKHNIHIRNLVALKGLPLSALHLIASQVDDLSPLKGMPIEHLVLAHNTKLKDIASLEGMPLKTLDLNYLPTLVSLAPLSGSQLERLNLGNQKGDLDLSPLVKLPLQEISLAGSQIHDLTPLKEIPDLLIENVSPGSVMCLALKSFESGDFPAAAKHFQKFEKDFADFKPFAEYVEIAKPLGELSQWAADGKEGVPPGAKTFQGSYYLRIKGYELHLGHCKTLAKHLGGHLPALSTKEEQDWFTENIGTRVWLGLERDDEGVWRWTNGEPMTHQAEWDAPQDKESKYVSLTENKKWRLLQWGFKGDFTIEWEGE